MLFQLHHQERKNPDNTIFCIQSELPDGSRKDKRDFMYRFMDKAWKSHPPPDGYMFMLCTEDAKCFLRTTDSHTGY